MPPLHRLLLTSFVKVSSLLFNYDVFYRRNLFSNRSSALIRLPNVLSFFYEMTPRNSIKTNAINFHIVGTKLHIYGVTWLLLDHHKGDDVTCSLIASND